VINDYHKMYELLSGGQDIDMRLQPQDDEFLLRLYKSRCKSGEMNRDLLFIVVNDGDDDCNKVLKDNNDDVVVDDVDDDYDNNKVLKDNDIDEIVVDD
jgi:hypothetical protein